MNRNFKFQIETDDHPVEAYALNEVSRHAIAVHDCISMYTMYTVFIDYLRYSCIIRISS